jgi:hypothetical protein
MESILAPSLPVDAANSDDMDKSGHIDGGEGIGSVHPMEVRVGYSSHSNFRKRTPGQSN